MDIEKRTRKHKFINQANERWCGFFDYSHSYYINSTTKILIICPIHGQFEQTPHNHLKSNGCRGCVPEKIRMDNESFIRAAKAKWGNKYDYSKTKFTRLKSNVRVTCPIHGDFFLLANSHLSTKSPHSCPDCKVEYKDTAKTIMFIKKSKAIWGDQFSYERMRYVNCNVKCTFTCKKHGDFEQFPSSHLSGFVGCSHCKSEQKRSCVASKDTFVEKAKAKWGDKYDYADTVYSGSGLKVKIRCKKHGVFEQQASLHTQGYEGCKKCLSEKTKAKPVKRFIQKSRWVWGDRYDYSKVNYINARTNVTIICKEHGEFQQTPTHHTTGNQGCKKCLYHQM